MKFVYEAFLNFFSSLLKERERELMAYEINNLLFRGM